jgi:hypothetical protein
MEVTTRGMARAVELGFRAVKMEVLFEDRASDRDLRRLHPRGPARRRRRRRLLVDFGYRWRDWRDAQWVLRRLEGERLFLAEAALPHDDLASHARLAGRVETRVGGAELASTWEECRAWLDVGRVDVLQPDVARAGGLTELRRICQSAAERGAQVVPHCWKTGIDARRRAPAAGGVGGGAADRDARAGAVVGAAARRPGGARAAGGRRPHRAADGAGARRGAAAGRRRALRGRLTVSRTRVRRRPRRAR